MSFSKVDKGYRRKDVLRNLNEPLTNDLDQMYKTATVSASTATSCSTSQRMRFHKTAADLLSNVDDTKLRQFHLSQMCPPPPTSSSWTGLHFFHPNQQAASFPMDLSDKWHQRDSSSSTKPPEQQWLSRPIKQEPPEPEPEVPLPLPLDPYSRHSLEHIKCEHTDDEDDIAAKHQEMKPEHHRARKSTVYSPHYPESSSSLSSTSSASLSTLSKDSDSLSRGSCGSRNSRKRRRQDTLLPEDCPFTVEQVVQRPIDEFNQLLHEYNLNEEKQHQYKELRRKGKNRVAAFKSRQNRLNRIKNLTTEKEQLERAVIDLSRTVADKSRRIKDICAQKNANDLERLKMSYSPIFLKMGIAMDLL